MLRAIRRRRVGATIVAVMVASGAGLAAHPPAAHGASDAGNDLNGDGRSELVIGVGGEDFLVADAGGVHVLAGTALGVRARAGQFWHQDSPGIPGDAEASDGFGGAWAAGDFDGDGYDDLAIGAPGESIGAANGAGHVTVLYGSPFGVYTTDASELQQNMGGLASSAEAGDGFGSELTSADFDRDGRDDLAVGVPGEGTVGTPNAGAVQIVYGTAGGLDGSRSRLFEPADAGTNPEAGDRLGTTLATGDFNADDHADLAIGAPAEGVAGNAAAGAATVLYGSTTGLVGAHAAQLHQDVTGVVGIAEPDDGFGGALAAGDFDGDGDDDLAVGASAEDVGATNAAGVAHVFLGGPFGVIVAGNRQLYQGNAGVPGSSETLDRFGAALAAGDFDGDGTDALAIGTPGESFQGFTGAGTVMVLDGSASGLTAAGSQLWSQDSQGVLDVPEIGDGFGSAVQAGDFNGDGRHDLTVVSGEGVGAQALAGAVHVLYGSASGIIATGSQQFTQDTPGVLDTAEANDLFGLPL